jgi:hypothetical protein
MLHGSIARVVSEGAGSLIGGQRFMLLAAMLTAACAASPAGAQSIEIVATGTIPGKCTVAVASPFGGANLSVAGSVQASASVDCNNRFKLNALSSNGALVTATVLPTGSSFVRRLDYSLALSFQNDAGVTISATCPSAELTTGRGDCALSPANSAGLSSGAATAINRIAGLTVSWAPPALPARLVAGSYSDTITLSIAVQP